MGRFIDLTNRQFGRLTVVQRLPHKHANRYYWLCQCECGKQATAAGEDLRNGNKRSCGCLAREASRATGKKLTRDLSGQRFGRLLVIRQVRNPNYKYTSWICRCDCGTMKVIAGQALKNGSAQSCQCLRRERNTKHGQSKSRTYRIWLAMHKRCKNKNSHKWHRYGGRGIEVCARWSSFESFLADMGEAPPGKSIDRINNDGNYEPANCKWSTNDEQANNRSSNKKVGIGDSTLTVSQWCRIFGINPQTALDRIRNGWDPVEAVRKPGKSSFAGRPSNGRPEGLPPTHRDPETGADTEVAVSAEAMPAGSW